MPHAPPYRLKHILVASDFSAVASMATRRAADLARTTRGELRLLHVLSTSMLDELRTWLGPDAPWQDRLHQQAQRSLETQARELGQSHQVPVESLVIDGPPVQTATEMVQGWPADLLVVGARGDNPLHHLLIGTTAERLLGNARQPLLLVRTEPATPYRRVLLPLDFSTWSESAITLAQAVAPGAHLVLMHSFSIPFEEKLRFAGVNDDTLGHYREHARRDARDHLYALVDRHSLQPNDFTLCLTEGDAPLHILTTATERDCDLIVIGKHGRQAADELLLGSVTRHVLTEADCDVLVSTHRD
ncbi:universal stress protein [Hydrogenophaga sp.]|uniref:universal stress protein n=1 Tax=Hydrogenophaga sp. TaxID=1904254 RepID=UPI0025C27C4A|nr:universal stress protein [Hydrogenophaga sp.]